MPSFTSVALLAFCGIAAVRAQAPSSVSAGDLAVIDAEYENAGLDNDGNSGFGTDLDAEAILTVVYGSTTISNGQPYTVAQVTDAPDIYVTPSAANAARFNSSTRYTLMLADASSLGDPDKRGNYRHFLANSLTGAAGSGSNLTFSPQDGTVITSYATPGPIAGTGPHRYAWLLFIQPTNFQAPANLSSPGVSPGVWSVEQYRESTNIELVAASFFTVQNGNPTGSVAATSAVNTASIESSANAAASSQTTKSGAGGGSSTSASAPAKTSAGGSGGNSAAPASTVASFAALVLGAVAFAVTA